MSFDPLEIFQKVDPKLHENVKNAFEFAMSDGALSRKIKILIALALDASNGAVNGVKSLTNQALREGASKEEITEALRVAYLITGVGSVYTSIEAMKSLLK